MRLSTILLLQVVIIRVCAITKCEVVDVNPDHANEGQFFIHVNITGMGGLEFEVILDWCNNDIDFIWKGISK